MSTTPGKPRISGIPTPGKSSGIPTSGRFRSVSNVNSITIHDPDAEYASRALADAIKANDPAHHRSSLARSASPFSASQSTGCALPSGRRSVAGRPSVTSIQNHARAKTPSARPPSRQSDIFARSVSRTGNRSFDIGENVRIESLGYEGILKYLGEIDGKPGQWAGVELSGGFEGKGKNDGSVNGKRYFMCPPNCGVFVALAKLSAPTVGPSFRPPSVASSRSGRVTPSVTMSLGSGRVTPSNSFGRITPFTDRKNPLAMSGRITPSATPSARKGKQSSSAGKPLENTRPNLESQITSGSRASRYIGLTAKQLNSRPIAHESPNNELSLRPPPSPARTLESHPRSSDSPFTTPKARAASRSAQYPEGIPTPGGKQRPPLNTPRPRIPSSVAMPPPPCPVQPASVSSQHSPNDDQPRSDDTPYDRPPSSLDLAASAQTLQDKINRLITSDTSTDETMVSAHSPSPADVSTLKGSEAELAALNASLDSLQKENSSLRETVSSLRANGERHRDIERERDIALSSLAEMEKEVRSLERRLSEKDSRLEMLGRSHSQSLAELERSRMEGDARLNDLQAKLGSSEILVKSLKEAIEVKEGAEHESDALLKAKNAEIALLEGRLEKLSTELDMERKELGAQIEELRQAGQETIALYEERLSAADGTRYDLEDRIVALEEQVKKATTPLSTGVGSQRATAAEIDNETLREQVQHLQKKLSTVEDILEDVRAASEREEAAMREKIKRFKEKEDAMRSELNEGRKTVEQVAKAEALAKTRIEEVEEALRESTLALEDARAEIEALRSDAAAVDAGVNGEGNGLRKHASTSRLLPTEHTRLMEEIQDSSNSVPEDSTWHSKYEDKCTEVVSLRKQLDEQLLELENTRKRLNRDLPVNGLSESSKSSTPKHESEEIKGLKHIVQELQKEIEAVTQRNKLLESENRLLMSETDQLRQELKVLEDNVEQSLSAQEAILNSDNSSQYEPELEQLRKRLAEAEMKAARVAHDLNKEISELEALVESKDELEQEIEHLKEKLSRGKKKDSLEPGGSLQRKLSIASTLASSDEELRSVPSDDICEICEQPGHDIFTCDLLKDGAPKQSSKNKFTAVRISSEQFCVDCEGYGHVASDCPHSLDVF
ncbi:hypothetical protein V8B97DRAFT_2021512 [Scleroderma yunnanense]